MKNYERLTFTVGDRHEWRRQTRTAVLAFVALVTVACSATYPTRPAATPSVLRMLHQGPAGYLRPSTSMVFAAYAIDTDGVYTEVSAAVSWQSSNASVLSVAPTRIPPVLGSQVFGVATAVAPGVARLTVSYQGLTDSESFTVGPTIRPLPYIEIRMSGSYPITLDPQAGAAYSVSYLQPLSSQNIDNLATVTSSDPNVARVEGGRIMPIAPGPFRIIATYNGLTETALLSVYPPTRSVPRP